jgi:hypothetical protein
VLVANAAAQSPQVAAKVTITGGAYAGTYTIDGGRCSERLDTVGVFNVVIVQPGAGPHEVQSLQVAGGDYRAARTGSPDFRFALSFGGGPPPPPPVINIVVNPKVTNPQAAGRVSLQESETALSATLVGATADSTHFQVELSCKYMRRTVVAPSNGGQQK